MTDDEKTAAVVRALAEMSMPASELDADRYCPFCDWGGYDDQSHQTDCPVVYARELVAASKVFHA